MIIVPVDYATPSVFHSDRDRALLGISANQRRPVRFHGRVVQDAFLIRLALRALGEIVWSDDTWQSSDNVLDPVITVHPDRLFFEAFSQDQSVYAMVIFEPELFTTEGDTITGTTNIDFTAWLWAALAEMRSRRETWLCIGAEGFELQTFGAGGRFESKVELPIPWVRGFLNLQEAMAMPGTTFKVRPVDLLAAIRYLRYTKAKISPRALRYEFIPDQAVRLILEPWEESIVMKNSSHRYAEPHSIRVWGRRRLRLIESLLPFADRVAVYLKGRALPSFYAVHLNHITFVLGLSGWTGQQWTATGGLSLLSLDKPLAPALVDRAQTLLATRYQLSISDCAHQLEIDRQTADQLMVRLCRHGRAIYDITARAFRHRELFENPIDEKVVYPIDTRLETARRYIQQDRVRIDRCEIRKTTQSKRLDTPEGRITRQIVHCDWRVTGQVDNQEPVEIVVNDTGRIIFGTCGCPFFQENLLNQGPCEHMRALLTVSADQRKDQPTSIPALITD